MEYISKHAQVIANKSYVDEPTALFPCMSETIQKLKQHCKEHGIPLQIPNRHEQPSSPLKLVEGPSKSSSDGSRRLSPSLASPTKPGDKKAPAKGSLTSSTPRKM